MATKVARSAIAVFFEYDTQKIVHIRSKKVGIINRTIQLAIIGYIVGYVIVYKKGYQDFGGVQSSVTTKVKGIVFSNFSKDSGIGMRTWDVADYVIPPQENNAFFVMTNVIVTEKQSESYCGEDPSVKGSNCTDDAYCESIKGTILSGGNGPISGRCVESELSENDKVCEIFGWCPLENDKLNLSTPVLSGSQNFTVFIKNNIKFPKFDVKRRNLPDNEDDAYLKSCLYNSESSRDKFCPIFRLKTIVQDAGANYEEMAMEVSIEMDDCKERNILGDYFSNEDFSKCRWNKTDPKNKFCPIFILNDIAKEAGVDYDDLTMQGGVMQITIDWTCNLDHSVSDCVPVYTFSRLDSGDFTISKGFNFRYADKFMEGNTTYRTLYKAYGIRFLVNVQGQAGKFSVIPLLLNIASGLALLSIATIVCDIFVLYVLKARHFYRGKKYLDVKGQDAFEILEEEKDSISQDNSVKRRNVTNSLED